MLVDFFSDNIFNLLHKIFVSSKVNVNHRRHDTTIPGRQSHSETSLAVPEVERILRILTYRRIVALFQYFWKPGRKPKHGNLIEQLLTQRDGANATQLLQFIPLKDIGWKSAISEPAGANCELDFLHPECQLLAKKCSESFGGCNRCMIVSS